MKLRVIATVITIMALGVGSASAQSIGVFGDPTGASCSVTALPGVPGTFWILAVLGGSVPGMTGAEFKVQGMEGIANIDWLAIETANNTAAVALGSPLGAGSNIAFANCQGGSVVTLYTVTLIVLNPSLNNDVTLGVTQHTSPSNPNFQCSLMTQCDAPAFTKECVPGGEGFLNSTRVCTVGVEKASWGGVKALYN